MVVKFTLGVCFTFFHRLLTLKSVFGVNQDLPSILCVDIISSQTEMYDNPPESPTFRSHKAIKLYLPYDMSHYHFIFCHFLGITPLSAIRGQLPSPRPI